MPKFRSFLNGSMNEYDRRILNNQLYLSRQGEWLFFTKKSSCSLLFRISISISKTTRQVCNLFQDLWNWFFTLEGVTWPPNFELCGWLKYFKFKYLSFFLLCYKGIPLWTRFGIWVFLRLFPFLLQFGGWVEGPSK